MRPEALLTSAGSDDPGLDAAIGRLASPAQDALVIAVDTLVSEVHFRAGARAEDVAYKAVAVNLSDLAAMGAAPMAIAVSLTAEKQSGSWTQGFRRGLAETARAFGVEVVAAEIAYGSLSVTVEAFGRVPPDAVLRRNGARPGDGIYVTGTLGDAGLGLALAKGEVSLPPDEAEYVLKRLDRPQPRVAAGTALRGVASSAIDISDGLVGDLGHILRQSGVGASVQIDRIPLSPVMRSRRNVESALELALGFGDDYELCFTLPESQTTALKEQRGNLACSVTEIGVVEAQPGLKFHYADGRAFKPPAAYDHFRP